MHYPIDDTYKLKNDITMLVDLKGRMAWVYDADCSYLKLQSGRRYPFKTMLSFVHPSARRDVIKALKSLGNSKLPDTPVQFYLTNGEKAEIRVLSYKASEWCLKVSACPLKRAIDCQLRIKSEALTADILRDQPNAVLLTEEWYWETNHLHKLVNLDCGTPPEEGFDFQKNGGSLLVALFRDMASHLAVDVDSNNASAALATLLERRRHFKNALISVTGLRNLTKRYFRLSGRPVFSPDGGFSGYRGVATDMTDQVLAVERARYLANHDTLTGLGNRLSLYNFLAEVIETVSGDDHDNKTGIILADIERFQRINDNFGHSVGDALLVAVARRIECSEPDCAFLARVSADQFCICLQYPADRISLELQACAARILSLFNDPFFLDDHKVEAGCYAGAAVVGQDTPDADQLLRHAQLALKNAKRTNIIYRFFDNPLRAKEEQLSKMEHDLRYALERNEILVAYQPQIDILSNRVIGVEALLRWKPSHGNLIPPMSFIPIAEKSGIIVDLGRFVLNESIKKIALWRQSLFANMRMSINVSPVQFWRDDIVSLTENALQEYSVPPEAVELEITENVLISDDSDKAKKILERLNEIGVSVALDDFGTGYSSLYYLQTFPINRLKIDRSFITDIESHKRGRAITQTIIQLGKTLGLEVVAEGVETRQQISILESIGCDVAQGYLFSKPLFDEQYVSWFNNYAPSSKNAPVFDI